MLPFTHINKSSKTIYINPNFKGQLPGEETIASLQTPTVIPMNAHINPLFLEPRKYKNAIHMNPAFLQNFQEQQQKVTVPENISKSLMKQSSDVPASSALCKTNFNEERKIICKSKNRLIREPLITNCDYPLKEVSKISYPLQPLLLLNKRKLIRKVSIVPENFNKSATVSFNDSHKKNTKYKLDNRMIKKKHILPPTPRIKRTSFVGRYALKRTSLSESSSIPVKRSLSVNKNKKLRVLNINGLLYKSTRNSLKLKDISTVQILKATAPHKPSEKQTSSQGLTIFVRGHKYVMDVNKFKLTRITNCDMASSNRVINNSFKASTCQRIDIGGYTYVSTNSAKNVLIRTKNHLSRAYVHNAKQKSLQTLNKRFVKTNIPCPIFQRVGKCAAFERGKCSKVHNKLQVAICSKFLRGECLNGNCLLSHNVSLSKMPVCKFFLQGVCVRNDCQYLHKKLSNTAELCLNFLRGFCQLADKCNKRHEFVCPEIERSNICRTKNCVYCNAKRRKELQSEMKTEKLKNKNEPISTMPIDGTSVEYNENQHCKRYFIDSTAKGMENTNIKNGQCINEHTANNIDVTEDYVDSEKNRKMRPRLGTLPSYIPL